METLLDKKVQNEIDNIIGSIINDGENISTDPTLKKFTPIQYDLCDQAEDIYTFIVTCFPDTFKHIERQTEKICLAAVKQNGLLLEFVEEQTEEICITAVKQNGMALKFVGKINFPGCKPINQTKKIYITAIEQNPQAVMFMETPKKEYKNPLK